MTESNLPSKDSKSLWSGFADFLSNIIPFSRPDVNLDRNTLRERQRFYVLKYIEKTLVEVSEEQDFQVKRTCLVITAIIFLLLGLFLLIWGLSLTNLFASSSKNYILISFSTIFLITGFIILYKLIFPNEKTKEKLKNIEKNRLLRKNNTAVKEAIHRAQLAADAERPKLLLIAKVNRKSFNIHATTMGEFIQIISELTELPSEQMLLIYNGEVIQIEPEKTMEGGYGFNAGDVIDVCNRGGYEMYLQKKFSKGYAAVAPSRLTVGTSNVNWKAQVYRHKQLHSGLQVQSHGPSNVLAKINPYPKNAVIVPSSNLNV